MLHRGARLLGLGLILIGVVVIVPGCGGSSSAAMSACVRASTSSDDSYLAHKFCGCLIPKYVSAGGNPALLVAFFDTQSGLGSGQSINQFQRNMRLTKELARPGPNHVAFKTAGTPCLAHENQWLMNDPDVGGGGTATSGGGTATSNQTMNSNGGMSASPGWIQTG